MRIGIIVPQGWNEEFAGWPADLAWARVVDVARRADALGVESLWLYDHFHTTPRPREVAVFECLTTLAALAPQTVHARLGQIVLCAGYRNPALTAKMLSTLDVISGGRAELGIGAGWKRDEWEAYGYGFPPIGERMRGLEDALRVVRAMIGPGRANVDGAGIVVRDAINEPKPLQGPRLPVMVGGNGRNVTWRLAARYADELNLDGVAPEELPEAMAVIASRCEEIGRDPATLPVSVHLWWRDVAAAPSRTELLRSYREAGVSRVMLLARDAVRDIDEVDALVEDARRAGAELGSGSAAGAA